VIKDVEQLKSRVVRSSSCTVKLLELDLQVNPGSSATGYVSNVEGVLNRFLEVVNMVLNDLKSDFVEKQNETDEDEISSLIKDIEKLEAMIESIDNVGTSKSESLTLEFLDPHGNSMIIDSNATERELSEDELEALPVGPEPAVFSKNEL